MNSRTKKLVSLLCVAAMLVSALPMSALAADEGEHDHSAAGCLYVNGAYVCNPDVAPKDETAAMQNAALFAAPRAASGFLKAEGYQEGAYATWSIGAGVSSYTAYVAPAGGNYVELDKELVREYPGYMRADALGLKAGTYTIKVVDNLDNEMVTDPLTVVAHERTGFGFVGGTSSGAYNADGTLKSNAVVVYADNRNFNSVRATIGGTSYTGVQSIVSESGASKGAPGIPVCIRILGTIDDTTGFPKGSWGSSKEGLQVKAGSAKAKNLTIEGVGNDAAFNGFGMLIRNCENVEVRNLALMNFADDGISIDTDNEYLWIHNNDFFYGGPGSDSDQVKGDGSLDAKASYYCTFSYNHFWDSGKCSLLGMKNPQDYFTYHHNWFDHSDSRHPRIRLAKSVHIYNNYYDGNSKYGVGAALNSGAFVEANYFRNCKYPMLSSMQGSDIAGGKGTFSSENGGVIKAYNNKIIGAQGFIPYDAQNAPVEFDAYVAKTRDEKVPGAVAAKLGGTTYTNFDTTSNIGVTASQVQSPDDAMLTTTKWAGRVNGGDFQWVFNNAVDDESYAVNAGLKNALTTYKTTLVSVGGAVTKPISGGETHEEHTPGAWKVTKVPGCDPDTQELVPGEETQYCTICGAVVDTRKLPGAHSNDGNGKCTVCGKTVANGGGSGSGSGGGSTATGDNKTLRASDFKMTNVTNEGKESALVANEVEDATKGYFHYSGNVLKRKGNKGSTEGTSAEFFQLPNNSTDGFWFEVKEIPATVTVAWGSPKKEQTASMVIRKDGETTPLTGTGEVKKGKNFTTSLELSDAGKYWVTSAAGVDQTRIFSVIVTEPPKSHTWGDWEIVTSATCGQDGLMKRECQDADCDEVEYDTIEATGNHTWGDWKDVGDGMEERECSECHETETRASGSDEPTPPTPADKTGLTDIIAKAKTYLSGVMESDDAAKVPVGDSWALKADIDDFKTAIANAQTTADKADATADDVSKATTALSTAITTFAGKIKDGTKPNGGGSTTGTSYVLDISEEVEKGLTTAGFPAATPATKVENLGTNGVFTIFAKATGGSGVKKKDNSTTFTDYTGEYGFNTGGSVADDKLNKLESDGKDISFTTNAVTTVKVWWASMSQNGSSLGLATKAGDVGPTKITTDAKCGRHVAQVTTIENVPAGTQYVYGTDGSILILRIEATETSGSDDPTPPTSTVDKTALNDAIADAKAKLAAAVTSKDGSDVEPSKNWATKENKELLAAKIALADLAAKTAKTEADVKAALDELKAAVAVLRPGTKTTTPDNPGGGGGGGGGGSSSSAKKPTGQITDTSITMSSNTTADRVAVSELTDSQAKTLIDNAVKGGSDEIVVNVNAPRSAAGVSLNVSANTMKNMSGKTDAALALQTPVGNVRFPHAAVADLGGNGGKDISFTIARTDNGMKVTVTSGDKILDQLDGGVTVVANANENGDVAYILTADGSEKLLKKSYVEDGKLYANLPGSGEIVLKDNSKTFRDVENNWAKPGIDFAASRELFNGVNELDFAPNQAMTRSMLVTVLYRLEGAKGGAANKFADVPTDSWYTEAVAWASAQGVVSGKSATHFGPDDDITREQLATILYRYATKLCGMSEVGKDSKALEKFSDKAVVSGFAEDGMAWCVEQGIIGGRGDGTLAPGGFASRAEVATMLMRFVKAIV